MEISTKTKGRLLLTVCLTWALGAVLIGASLMPRQQQTSAKEWDFLPQKLQDEQTIWIYAGYIGCDSECPTALSQMAGTLNDHQNSSEHFLFINLVDLYSDTSAQEYASQFHTNIYGISLSGKEKQHFTDLTGIQLSASLTDSKSYNHTDWFIKLTKTASGWSAERSYSIDS
jgi:cytochrome oxidase Cu insertion factor (SCO1/SenC/PrrC family)